MKFVLCLLTCASLLSCTSSKSGDSFSQPTGKVIFSEDFKPAGLKNLEERFFVLGGRYTPSRMGGRHTISSSYSGVTQSGLLFGPKNLKDYTLEASFFFTSTAGDTIAAGLGGGGQRGFKIHLVPQSNNSGILRITLNGAVYDQSNIKMIPDTWYKIYLKVSHKDGDCHVMSTVSNEKVTPSRWLVKHIFNRSDFSGQALVLSYPVSRIPLYIDDIAIRSHE